MPDDLTRRQPEDPKQINVNQDWELNLWSKKFGVSKDRIKEAVKAVGPWVKDVKEYLGI